MWPTPVPQLVSQEYGRAGTEHTGRRQRLEQDLQERVTTWRLAPVGDALRALRGVQCTVAVTAGAELGDRTRFTNPKPRMRYLGPTPAAYPRGPRRPQGGITKTGHRHARRAPVEGARACR